MKKQTEKTRKKRETILLIAAIFCLMTILLYGCFVIAGRLLGCDHSGSASINYDNVSVECPKIHEMFLTPNKNSRPQIPLRQVNGIVIHYTANPGTDAKANRDYFEGRKNVADKSINKVSSHFVIGLNGKIIQCIPLNEISYASNSRNKDTISIECCHPDNTGKFSEQTYRSLVHLCAYLCVKYRLPKDDIIRHYDVTGKLCPKYYVQNPEAWKQLKDDIFTKIK